MGVITTAVLTGGKIFGPIPAHITLTDPALLIGRMTSDNRPDVHTVKLDLNDYAERNRVGEWVPYVQSARDENEQNVEAFMKDGQLHYRVLRTIHANEELFVWYHNDMANMLGVPPLQSFHIKNDGHFSCPYCMKTFRYPYSVQAHMRFNCEQRKPMDLSSTFAQTITRPAIGLKSDSLFPPHLGTDMLSLYEHPSRIPVNQISPLIQDEQFRIPTSIAYFNQLQNTLQSSPAPSSKSSTSHSTLDNLSPSRDSVQDMSRKSPLKRPASKESYDELSPVSKRVMQGEINEVSMERNHKADQNQNFQSESSDAEEETTSAFRKVEKIPRSPPRSPPISKIPNGNHIMNQREREEQFIRSSRFADKRDINILKSFPPGFPNPAMVPSFPFLPVGLPNPLMPSANLNENLPLRIAEIYRNTFKMSELVARSGGDKLADIRNIENNNIPHKMPFFAEPRTAQVPLQYYKSQNPMVDKLLHSPDASIVQNWCAKCNATFRMTSDLVYHMRSHHKLPNDPMKKKREEKLKCNVCGETFRERHHLTRHMSSHV